MTTMHIYSNVGAKAKLIVLTIQVAYWMTQNVYDGLHVTSKTRLDTYDNE